MIKLYDRIKEISYTIGTGNVALSGAVTGFSTFSSVYANNDPLFYSITDGTNYEIGSGLYVSASNQIKRFPVKSTNSNQLVSFSEGVKEIYVNYPATNSVFNTSGINTIPQNSGLSFWTSSNSLSYSDKLVFDSGNNRIGINKSIPSFSIDVGGLSANSSIAASGFITGTSGIYFPSGNGGLSSYSGGRQLFHFEKNQLGTYASQILELSGIVNQHILLKKQNVNTVFAGPSGACSPPCNPDYPTFRALVKEDIPDLSSLYSSFSAINAVDIKVNTVSGIVNSVSGNLQTQINNISGGGVSNSGIFSNFRISTSLTDALAEGSGTGIYIHPYNGNSISVFDGSKWETKIFSSTLAINNIGLNNDTNYDLFAYLNGNSLTFETAIWTNNTTRATQVTLQDGVYCKSGDKTRRYIGTVRKKSNFFMNTYFSRYVFNAHNRIQRFNMYIGNGDSWTINSDDFTESTILGTLDFVHGLPETLSGFVAVHIIPPGVRSSYQILLIDQYTYYNIVSGNTLSWESYDSTFTYGDPINNMNTISEPFYVDYDSFDLVQLLGVAKINTKFVGYFPLKAYERKPLGSSPTISYLSSAGSFGLAAISYQ